MENDGPTPESQDATSATPEHPGAQPPRRELSLAEYRAGVLAGDRTIVARAVTLVESQHAQHELLAEQLLASLSSHTGAAIRVGITGAPGVGKSTFIDALGVQLTQAGHRVAVLAVDPTSELSGGSILGDKTRMTNLAAQPTAFIRPSPSGGTLGGVARRTREALLICEAAGYDVVLVETVGVGQSETLVAEMTDVFLALLLPGAGDELQGLKRGLLELVDVLAVNKCDSSTRAAAEQAAQHYRSALAALATRSHAPPQVFTCSARERTGISEVWEALQTRYATLRAAGHLALRRQAQSLRWMWLAVDERLRQAVRGHPGVQALQARLEAEVGRGELTPDAAARAILQALGIKDRAIP